MRGVFLDKATIAPQGVDFSNLDNSLSDWQYFDNTSQQAILTRVQDAELVMTNKVPLSQEVLLQAKNLKCICVAATGFDHIDVQTARSLGIFVCNVVNYSTPSVAQLTFGLMISLMSQIIKYHQLVLQGAWARSTTFCLDKFQLSELYGKTLGILGYGSIGKAVEQIAKAFGMKVLLGEHKERTCEQVRPGRVLFQNLLSQSDIVTLHCPLLTETFNLIGAAELQQMKTSAIIINVARGGLINEAALYEALVRGQIGGAGLDVLAKEPPEASNPLLSPDCPNIIFTPHVAWSSVESRQRLVDELALNVLAFKQGQQRNSIL